MNIHILFGTYFSDKKYHIIGDEVIWLDESPEPTKEEIEKLWKKYLIEEEYKTHRQQLYTSTGATPDQMIIALWESIVEGKADSLTQLQLKRAEVKSAIPKPKTDGGLDVERK